MEELYLIAPNKNISDLLRKMIQVSTSALNTITIDSNLSIPDLRNKKIIFALELDQTGNDIEMIQFFSKLYALGSDSLYGSTAGILLHSCSDYSTKRTAQNLIFMANELGCSFIGHPLVEATNSLHNFLTRQKTVDLPLHEICLSLSAKLVLRLLSFEKRKKEEPKVLVLYSTPHKTSNTLDLWHMCSKHMLGLDITELQIENGEVKDCKGCSYTLCKHFGELNRCFYGGFMVENILPSIEKSDAIIWLCPNYNDAISANLTAVINRLTVLYYKLSFYEKQFFSIVVSGNSGSDSVVKQLIGALNINKGFHLPSYSYLTAIANDPGAILKVENIETYAKDFAKNLMYQIKK